MKKEETARGRWTFCKLEGNLPQKTGDTLVSQQVVLNFHLTCIQKVCDRHSPHLINWTIL